MKKLITVISAILALLLVASPVMASAEEMNVVALQLSDPVVSMNGEPLLDMTGLMLQLAGGSTEDGSLTQLFVDLFAGGQNINSAIAQIDENGIAGYLGGMTNAYGVTADALGAFSIEGLGVTNFAELFTALENWTFLEDFDAIATDFAENDMVYGEPETIEVDLAAGKTSMTYVPFTVDATEYMYAVLELIENDELIGPLFLSAAQDEGYDSMTDMLKDANLSYTMEGGIGMTDDGSSSMMNYDYVMSMYGEPINAEMNMILDGSMGETQYLTMDLNMKPESSDESVVMTLNGTINGDDVSLEGSMSGSMEGADETVNATFSLTYASATGAGAGTDKLDVAIDVPGESTVTLTAYEVSATGESHMEFAVKDDYTDVSAYFTYTPAETTAAGVISSGAVELGFNDGTDTYSLASDVTIFSTVVDSADYYIAPGNVIDATNLTEEQQAALNSEMSVIMIQMLTNLEQSVPGLAGLMSSFMGGGQQ